MRILVTGGAGYIGSHTIVELLGCGYDVVTIDNLINSNEEALRRVHTITGKDTSFIKGDVRNRDLLKKVFQEYEPQAVIHFAGLKAVGESVKKALEYYQNNLESTLILLDIMKITNVKRMVFSSSATIYGDPELLPIREKAKRYATNPYGRTKLIIEQILEDMTATKEDWQLTSLRYFNPIGAHSSGKIGEDPNGIPNNLLPYISQVAIGKLKQLSVYGNNYNTPDGTGIRDYIHVVDLARAHVAALNHIEHPNIYKAYNIGTGRGTSVMEMIKAFEKASGKTIPYKTVGRRVGDIASCYADPTLAQKELGWKAEFNVDQACSDVWKWQSNNPNGYN